MPNPVLQVKSTPVRQLLTDDVALLRGTNDLAGLYQEAAIRFLRTLHMFVNHWNNILFGSPFRMSVPTQ